MKCGLVLALLLVTAAPAWAQGGSYIYTFPDIQGGAPVWTSCSSASTQTTPTAPGQYLCTVGWTYATSGTVTLPGGTAAATYAQPVPIVGTVSGEHIYSSGTGPAGWSTGTSDTVTLTTPSGTESDLIVGSGDDQITIGHGKITIGQGDEKTVFSRNYMDFAQVVSVGPASQTKPEKETTDMDVILNIIGLGACIAVVMGAVIGLIYSIGSAHDRADKLTRRLDAHDAAHQETAKQATATAEFERVKALVGGDEALTRAILKG